MCAFAKPADFEFSREGTMIGKTAGGMRSLEVQMVNSQCLK